MIKQSDARPVGVVCARDNGESHGAAGPLHCEPFVSFVYYNTPPNPNLSLSNLQFPHAYGKGKL